MFAVRVNTGDELFEDAIRACKTGSMTAPRQISTLEAPGPAVFELSNPKMSLVTNPYRRLNYVFAFAEMLWIWRGSNRLYDISIYNKKIADFSDDGETMAGAYGPPFNDQLVHVIETLTKDRDSRQAVITLWRPKPAPSKDIPCTVMLHFMVRDLKLDLLVYMRSNDVWLGLPYDIFTFTCLQSAVAAMLDIKLGKYVHMVGSLHMYAGDVYKAEWALRYTGKGIQIPYPTGLDLDYLTEIEQKLRAGLGVQQPDGSNWLIMATSLFNWKFHKTTLDKKFADLREESDRVRAAVGDSKESSAPPPGD